uniref:LIM zinc-binding domain-containing protein n=1 Tax=Scophthalmus maximus TaxID=52904 RepID=A0A8D3CMA8_SCOMX
ERRHLISGSSKYQTMADSSHCFYCREDLGGKRFVRSEGRPVCVRCHTKFCAHSCAECHRPISVENKVHKGRFWHEECFRCAKCYKPLAKEPFSTKDDRIMCGKCCSREDAPRCHCCYKPILAGTESVEYKGNSWHDECFTCFSCKRPIGSQSFLSKGSDIYCSPCYDMKFAKHCVCCKKGRVSPSTKTRSSASTATRAPWPRSAAAATTPSLVKTGFKT